MTETRSVPHGHDDEILIDAALVGRIIHRRRWSWLWKGLLGFGLLFLLMLCVLPQSYTATTSVAIQQPSSSSSLASVLGAAPQNTRYIGVLKSRQAAAEVERVVHLQPLYHLRTQEDALEMLMASVKPEDNPTDALLYIHVTLPAPPRLQPNTSARRAQVKRAAMQAANQYAVALRHYYATSDTDRETVLLRAADNELRRARAGYDTALASALSFSRGHDVDPRVTSLSALDPLTAAPADLSTLYTSLFQVQAQLRQAQAEQAVEQQQRGQQLQSIASLPIEDPLLTDARTRVNRDQSKLESLSAVYGPANPQVLTAEAQLHVDQAQLNAQVRGVRSHLTTEQVKGRAQIQGLTARQGRIEQQIAQSERRLGITRRLSGEYGRLQQEVAFEVEALKEAEAEAVKVRLENVSAMSRMQVIDEAILPKKSSPGLILPAIACLFLVFLGITVALAREYLAEQRLRVVHAPSDPHLNGTSPKHAVERDEVGTHV